MRLGCLSAFSASALRQPRRALLLGLLTSLAALTRWGSSSGALSVFRPTSSVPLLCGCRPHGRQRALDRSRVPRAAGTDGGGKHGPERKQRRRAATGRSAQRQEQERPRLPASEQERSFRGLFEEAWEKEAQPTQVPVTPQTVAGLLIVLYFYFWLMFHLVGAGLSSAAKCKPEPPMLTLQSGKYMKELSKTHGISHSQVLDEELEALVNMRRFQS